MSPTRLLLVLVGCSDGVVSDNGTTAKTDADADTDADSDADSDADTDTAEIGVYSVASYFGLCAGACQYTVAFDGGVVLTIEGWFGTGFLAAQLGTLTPAGMAELVRIDGALSAASLQQTYGCPDCSDGGGMRLVLDEGGSVTEHTWEFGAPPPALTDLDALFHDLRDALEDCGGSPWVTPDPACIPHQP